MSMTIKNCTDFGLTIQLCQVGVLYHAYVQPGEIKQFITGAVHFTIRVRVNNTGRDDTDISKEAFLPIFEMIKLAGNFAALVHQVHSSASSGLSAVGVGGISGSVGVVGSGIHNIIDSANTGMKSDRWYAGYNHRLEIHGG